MDVLLVFYGDEEVKGGGGGRWGVGGVGVARGFD